MTLQDTITPHLLVLALLAHVTPTAAAVMDGSLASVNASSPSPSLVPVPSPSHATSDREYSYYVAYACLYALGGLYLAPSAISWTRMSRNIYTEDKTAVRLFALLGFGALLRALAFLLVAVWMLFVVRSHGTNHEAQHLHLTYMQLVTAWQALGLVASLVLVSVFLLIFNTWASMIEQVDSSRTPAAYRTSTAPPVSAASLTNPHPPPRILFIRMVLVTNAFQIATFALVHVVPQNDFAQSLHFFATVLITACFAVCAFLLPAYGQRMCDLLGKVAEGAAQRQRNIRRVAAISAVFCIMRTLSQLLLVCSEYSQTHTDELDSDGAPRFQIPLKHIMEANPIFFFSPAEDATDGVLRWLVLLEVVEFPVEWTLLMTLLCVLPSRAMLPSIRGYQAIPTTTETTRRY